MRRALAIDEQAYGPDHPNVARPQQPGAVAPGHEPAGGGRAADAAGAGDRRDSPTGRIIPNVASGLNNLAQLLQATNRLGEAEPLMRRALAIDEQTYGSEHPDVAIRPQQPGPVAPGHEPAGRRPSR